MNEVVPSDPRVGAPWLPRPVILIVSADHDEREQIAAWLSREGHAAISVGDFSEATRQLDLRPPDVLIADVRLGAYNGLHLAIRARLGNACTPVIILGGPDTVLEAEAQRQGAAYLCRPFTREELLSRVESISRQPRLARRSVRKRIGRLPVFINTWAGTLVELSYEGFRLEIPRLISQACGSSFLIRVPGWKVACRARRVWTADAPGQQDAVWCGAVLAVPEAEVRAAWRDLVDETPGWSVAVN